MEDLSAAVRKRIQAMARQAMDRAEQDQELADRVQAMTASAATSGGEVKVSVNYAGHVTELVLSERAMKFPPQRLSAMIVESIRRAGAAVGEQVGAAVRESWGVDNPLTEHTVSAYDFFTKPKPASSPGMRTEGGILRPNQGDH